MMGPVALLASCSSPDSSVPPKPAASGLCGHPEAVVSVAVTRTNGLPNNHPIFTFPSKVMVNDSASARRVAEAVCALPRAPSRIICPADFGISYALEFHLRSDPTIDLVEVESTGCRFVRGAGAGRWVETSPTFWTVLGTAVGLTNPDNATFAGTMPG